MTTIKTSMTDDIRAKYIANLTDADKRRAAETLFLAYNAALDALSCACDEKGIDFDVTESDADAAELGDAADLLALLAARDAAYAAWRDFDCADVTWDEKYGYYSEAERCALTGFLIHDDDVVMIDENTGERVLKAALGVALDKATGEFVFDGVTDDAFVLVQEFARS